MIRITIAEGLKRMYKEYRLKQWSMLLDKAATLRRLLESESGHLDTDDSRNETGENHEDRNDVQVADNVPAPRDHINPSTLQQNWQMAAPEAYNWYPVTDYQNRFDTSGVGNQMISPRTGSQMSSPRVRNPVTSYDSSVQHQQVSTGDHYLCQPSLQRDSVRIEQPPTSVVDYNSNLIRRTGLPHHTSQTEQYPIVPQVNLPAMMTLRDTLDMDSLNTVVEEMEASFNEIEEMMTDQFTGAFNNELADSYHQVEPSAMVLPPLMSPLPDGNRSNRNLQQSFETPHASNTIHQMIMTSSPSAGVRVLDNMSQSTLLGAMGANPTARTRLLWRDDPPNPADNLPRILSRGTARDRETTETDRSEVNTRVSQPVNTTNTGPVNSYIPQPIFTTDNGPVNTYIPQPVNTTNTGRVNTYVPRPVYTTDNGPVNTYVPQPVYTTDNGSVNTYFPQPVYTTNNGPVNTYVPQPVYTTNSEPVNTTVSHQVFTTDSRPVNPTERDLFNTVNREPVNDQLRPIVPQRSVNPDQMEADADASFQSFVSWDSSLDPDDIDSLPGILFAAERLGPMDQTVHMDIEMGDFGIGHLLFDRAAGTWATSHCEFHRAD